MLALTKANPPDFQLVLIAASGACVAGAVVQPLFCRGHAGWAFLAAVLATTLGAALAAGDDGVGAVK